MNVYPLEQPKTENCFLEEAIDLLLLLEQELPQYINKGDRTVLENVIEIADKLKIGAEKFNLEAIFNSTNYLLEVLHYCLNNQVIVNDIIAQYLTNILESLQVLLMGYFIGSSVEEKKVLSKVENLVVDFNQYISEQHKNTGNFIENQALNIETEIVTTETPEKAQINSQEDIIIAEETSPNLTPPHTDPETRDLLTPTPEKPQINSQEDIILPEETSPNLTPPHTDPETRDLLTPTPESVTSNSIEEIIPDENISDAISLANNNPVVSNISNNVLEVVKESSVSEAAQIQQNELLVKTILDSNQQNTLSNVNPKDLEKIGTLLDSILNNNKLQTDTDSNQEKNLKKISKQIKRIQPLLEQITTCSQQLINSQKNPKVFNDSYSDLLNNSVDSVLAEISKLTSTFEIIKVNQRKKEQMNYEQHKLIGCSNDILNQVNNISFEELLQPLQNIWSQLQKLHHKTAILKIITPHSTVEKQLGEKIYTILLCFCCYLLEESLESEAIRQSLGKDAPGRITIESYKQNNNLIINISDDGRGLFLYPNNVLESSINATVNTQSFTTTFSELFLESKIFSEPEHYLSEISAMAVREIRQQLQGLEGTLNISSTPQQGTNININIFLKEITEQVIFFEKNSFVYGLVLSSVKQIIFPRIAKVVDTGKESNLILPNRAKTQIPIIQIEPIVAIVSDLVNKVQQPESESQNIDDKEQTYIIVADLSKAKALGVGNCDRNQNYAIEINRFLGKETVVINSLESQQQIPNYIVGTTTYKDNQSVLVLNGSLIDPTIASTIDIEQ